MIADVVARETPDVTIICVTYHSRDWAPAALRSAQESSASAGLRCEMIVIDNASGDGTAEAVAAAIPGAIVIRNPTNVGFGAANNQAFTVARGRWWLLLNPDATVQPDAVGQLTEAMTSDAQLAVAAPSVRGAGVGGAESAGMLPGIRSFAGHFLFFNRLLPRGHGGPWRGFQVRPWQRSVRQEVEWVSAAAVLLRPEAVRQVGGFDASIFLYGEDTDLGARLGDAGWRLAIIPGAGAWHAIGASQAAGSTAWLDGLHAYLVRRGAGRGRRALLFLIVAAGLGMRGIAATIRAREGGRRHARRMTQGARRAFAIAFGVPAPGRPPSDDDATG